MASSVKGLARGFGRSLRDYFRDISIEPCLFLFSLGFGVKYGAGVIDQLLLDKICLYELDQPANICTNLTEYPSINDEVQAVANEFNMYRDLLKGFLTATVSVFIGAFSDRFGFRWSMVLAIVGKGTKKFTIPYNLCTYGFYWLGIYFTDLQDTLNKMFLKELPLEFLYIESIAQSLFAGYYVGAYGLISNHAKPSETAFRFARMDSISILSQTIAMSMSAKIYEWLSYYGLLAINSSMGAISMVYIVFVTKETPEGNITRRSRKSSDAKTPERKSLAAYATESLVQPAKDLYRTVLKPRPNHRRSLLVIMLISMLMYYATLTDIPMLYPFMKLKYDVTYEEFSLFNTVCGLIHLLSLSLLTPAMLYILKMPEILILATVSLVGAMALSASAFVQTAIPGMMLTYAVANVRYCSYPTGRSLLTKMVEPEEVGKIYAILSLLITATGMVATLLYRLLYDATLDIFPSAFLLLSAVLYFCSAIISLFLFTQRSRLEDESSQSQKNMNEKQESTKL